MENKFYFLHSIIFTYIQPFILFFSLSSFLFSLSLSTVYGLFVPFKSWLRDLSAMKLKFTLI